MAVLGSDRRGRRAAAMYSLIVTAKMNGVDAQLRLADVLARIAANPAHRLDELLPWNCAGIGELLFAAWRHELRAPITNAFSGQPWSLRCSRGLKSVLFHAS